MRRSAVVTTTAAGALADHLLRDDGQEDLCFAVYHPSTGRSRTSGLLAGLILPEVGERHVHGAASFETAYFLRAAEVARRAGGGLAFLHSHPGGRGWQGMSGPDRETERRFAPRTRALTGMPLLGLTMAGDRSLSARFWERAGRQDYRRVDCESTRVVGDRLEVNWNDEIVPAPMATEAQLRTVTAWGPEIQADLARMRIGVIGAGSVGALVAEALARTGIGQITIMDFDSVEMHNLDRLLHATKLDARLARSKVEVLRRGLLTTATAEDPEIDALELSVVEEAGLAAALDCDLLFSCVDRPWPRAVLNYIAFAHLVPVVDTGIGIRRTSTGLMRSARWRSQLAAPGRRCLECSGQFDSGQVPLERDRSLDDPDYIKRLPEEHPLRARQNVFVFSAGAASLGLEQAFRAIVAPGGYADAGTQRHEFKPGTTTLEREGCLPPCPYSNSVATGDGSLAQFAPTGDHPVATAAREKRAAARRGPRIRLLRAGDDLLGRLSGWLGSAASKS